MTKATQLKAVSFNAITKLSDIDTLKQSFVEYIHIDGTDNNGRRKPALFNAPDFEENPHLRCLSPDFTNCKIKKDSVVESIESFVLYIKLTWRDITFIYRTVPRDCESRIANCALEIIPLQVRRVTAS